MSPEALIGVELGTGVLQRLLGQGTMGAVYLANQAGRQVAIKVFLPAVPLAGADNEVFLQCLEETVARGASLNHPHILSLLNYGRQEQLVYQVMPYIAGTNLEALLAGTERLPFARIQRYLEQLAAALDHAHAQGMLHGDVKARNILLTPAGDLLVSDFGLARLTIEKKFAGARRAVAGMLNTIAPEYVLSQAVDQRADVYSLGVVLYQMVTGQPPFQGASLGEVAMKHVKSAPPSPRGLRADLPQAAEQVILRALAKRPADRYSHARDLAAAFCLALETAGPVLPEKQAVYALSGSSKEVGRASMAAASLPAPRTGGLFDPRWRQQTPLPPVPEQAGAEMDTSVSPAVGMPFAEASPGQAAAAHLTLDERPTGPLPVAQATPGPGTLAAPEQSSTQAFASPQDAVPQVDFLPSADMTEGFRRTGLLGGMSRFQAGAQEASQPLPDIVSGPLQLADIPAANAEDLGRLAAQQTASPTAMLNALARVPDGNSNNETSTIKLTEAVKIVQVPIAGQPGRFMTGYLPVSPPEPPEPQTTRHLSTRMKIISVLLVIVVLAAGSGVFLLVRGTHNQAGGSGSRTMPDPQASATAQAVATANANIILSDTLSQNINQWPTGSQGWYTCTFQDGAYHIANHDKVKSAPALLPGKTLTGSFAYTLTMEQVKGDLTAPNNLFGMILDATIQGSGDKQVNKFYAFEILNKAGGQYEFWKYDSSKDPSNPWGNMLWHQDLGKEFHQGSGPSHSNTVKIIATGKMFTIIVNGQQVGTVKDSSFSTGSVGMLVNLDGAEIAFSNLLLTYS